VASPRGLFQALGVREMNSEQEITARESRSFRVMRILSPMMLLAFLALNFLAPNLDDMYWYLGVYLCGLLSLFVLYWQCPRCKRLFCFKFPFGWPYTNHCLHCGSRLQKHARLS